LPGDIPVAQTVPSRLAQAGQRAKDIPRLFTTPPPPIIVTYSGKPVDDRINIRRYMQAMHSEVVTSVDNY